MQQGYNTIIADTSCFILLDKIGELNLLLKLFGTLTTTYEVASEFGKVLPVMQKIQKPNFRFSDKVFNEILKLAGE